MTPPETPQGRHPWLTSLLAEVVLSRVFSYSGAELHPLSAKGMWQGRCFDCGQESLMVVDGVGYFCAPQEFGLPFSKCGRSIKGNAITARMRLANEPFREALKALNRMRKAA